MRIPPRLREMSPGVFLACAIALYLLWSVPLLLKWPPPLADEDLFASAARTLLHQGYLGTTIVKGLESHVYWQPPVYFLVLAPVIGVVGYSLTMLRLFSVLVSIGVIVLVFIIGLRLADPAVAKVAVFVLALDPRFVNTAAFVRMDSLCVLFLLGALALYVAPPFTGKSLNALATGGALALAALTHPLGLIGVTAFTLYVCVRSLTDKQERGRQLLLFVLPLVVGATLWGTYILQDPAGFLAQMKFQLARKDRPAILSILNVVRQYRLYPLSLAIPCAGLVYILYRAIRFQGKAVPVAILYAALTIAVVTKYETPYHVYLAPLGALSASMLALEFWRSGGKVRRYLSVACLCSILVTSLLVFSTLNLVYHFQLADETNYDEFCEAVSHRLPARATVIGWGTPSLYWGLYAQRPDVGFRDIEFFDSLSASALVKEVDYVVSTRAFDPDDDETMLRQRREYLSVLCAENGAGLRFIVELGIKKRFAYSAEIYQIVHGPER